MSSCVSAHMCVNACARGLQGGPCLHAEMAHCPRGELRAHRSGTRGRAPAVGRRPWPVESPACVLGFLGPPPAERKGGAAPQLRPGRCRREERGARPRPLVTRCHVLLPRRRRAQTMASQTAGRAGPPRPQSRASADTYSPEPTLGRPLCAPRRHAAAAICLALCLTATTFSIPLPLSALRLVFHDGRTGVTSSRKHFLACPSLVLTALSPPPPTWIPVLRPALSSHTSSVGQHRLPFLPPCLAQRLAHGAEWLE